MIGIIGASGHAKIIVDILQRKEPSQSFIYFSSQQPAEQLKDSVHYQDTLENLHYYRNKVDAWHVAIGNPHIRKAKMEFMFLHEFRLIRALHDQSIRAEQTFIGEATSIMAGVVVNPYASIGKGCVINTMASVDHDCVVDNYVNLGPGCRLAGGVQVGELSDVGTGAIVIPNKRIGRNCMIGAGAVIISDIPDNSVAVGVPAKIMKKVDGGS